MRVVKKDIEELMEAREMDKFKTGASRSLKRKIVLSRVDRKLVTESLRERRKSQKNSSMQILEH